MRLIYIGIIISLAAAIMILPPKASADNEWVYNTDTLTLNTRVESTINIKALSDQYSVQKIDINLSLFPRSSDSLEILKFEASPAGKPEGAGIIFSIKDPDPGVHKVTVEATVKAHNQFKKISEKIPFPIEDLPQKYQKYTLPKKNIDSDDPAIIEQASLLASGEDDLVVVLHKIGKWVHDNVDYAESGKTISGTKNASWVLRNMVGVCDEYSTLFIALVRALGIPAKYVSGVAYTNLDNINDWGPHAWAEVWIPGYSWTPYDATYGQLGFIDASHVKLKEALDSGVPAVTYSWKYVDADVKTESIDLTTKELARGKIIEPYVDLSIRAIKDKVGFGSYNLLELTVKNKMDYYISTGIQLADTLELENEDDLSSILLLKPNEEKKLYWIVKLKKDLNANYIYTVPIFAQSTRNATAGSEFHSTAADPVYSRKEIADLRDALVVEEKKNYIKELDLQCSPGKPAYYNYENGSVNCMIKNKGNIVIKALKVCMESSCDIVDLPINQEKRVSFPINMTSPGEKELVVGTRNDDFLMQKIVNVKILDEPDIQRFEKEQPKDLGFGEFFSVGENLRKTSYSTPQNLTIRYMLGDKLLSEMHAINLTINQKYKLELNTDMMPKQNNTIDFIVIWYDGNGRRYQFKDKFEININNLNHLQRIALWINRVELWLESIF